MGVKEGYKLTEVGVIPEDWEVLTLGEACIKVQDGNYGESYPKANEFLDYGVPFLTSKAIGKYGFLREDLIDYISPQKHLELAKAHIESEDVLFTNRGASVGAIGFVSVKIAGGNIGPQLTLLRANQETALPSYLYHLMKSEIVQRQIINQDSGSAMNFFGIESTKKFLLPIPIKTEQKAIATALSDIDGLINSLTKLIEKKKSIKQGAMQELLTGKKRLDGFSGEWVEIRLGDIAEVTMGQSPDSKYYNTVQEGLPLIQGNADIRNRKTIIRNYTSQITRTAQMKDIIMTVRAPVGYIGKATFDCCIGRGVCSISYKNDYFYYYLISIEGNWNKLSAGSTFDSVSTKDVNDLPIKIPPTIEEQNAIATILSDMDSEIETLQTKLDKYKSIKQGMMQELLTGRIRLLEGA